MRRIALVVFLLSLVFFATQLRADSLRWPLGEGGGGAPAVTGMAVSQFFTCVILDPTAPSPGTGTPVRAPMTGW